MMFHTDEAKSMSRPEAQDNRPPVEVKSVLERIEKIQVRRDSGLVYYYFASSRPRHDLPLFVTVHGIRRRAIDQVRLFAPLIDALGGTMMAPLFQRKRFSDYQRLGRPGKGARSDLALQHMMSHLKKNRGGHFDGLVMFGYSGGGQFVHRFAMAYPRQVKRLAIAAPGWFTFPDLGARYPEGVKKTSDLPDLYFDTARFLKIPAIALVGELDTMRDRALNQRDRIDRRQGLHRLERARRWVTAMSAAAAQFRYDTEYTFEMVPGCGHSFLDCMTRGAMGPKIIRFLFNQNQEAAAMPIGAHAVHTTDHAQGEG